MELAEQLIEDIANFKAENGCDAAGNGLGSVNRDLSGRNGSSHARSNRSKRRCTTTIRSIAPSMIYAYAALKSGVPFANGAPNLTVDIPALTELAEQNRVPDLRQGFQDRADADENDHCAGPEIADARPATAGTRRTFSETATAKFSTIRRISKQKKNQSFRCSNTFFSPMFTRTSTKIFRTSSASTTTRRAAITKKAGTISIFSAGLAIQMQIKIDFLCRDSILAAPLVPRSGVVSGPCTAGRDERRPGMAFVLLQISANRTRAISRTRPLHSADEAKKHPPPSTRRRTDNAPGA